MLNAGTSGTCALAVCISLAGCQFDPAGTGADPTVADSGATSRDAQMEDALFDGAAFDASESQPGCATSASYTSNSMTGRRYRHGPTGLDWFQARTACEEDEAHLAVIEDAEEDTYLAGLSPNVMWIGAHDHDVEGTFVWLTGTAVDDGYTNWRAGQPDNNNGGPAENCALIRVTEDWNDAECDRTDPEYLCECPAIP